MIDLRTLGALDLRRREGPELHSVLAQAKRTALLVYLVLGRPHGFHRRDTLIGLFWPEHDTEHARNNLRQSVHFLRRSLGEGAIVSRGDEDIGVADGVLNCDALQFDADLDADELERGLHLYAGDLLPGFFVEEAPDFENWLEGERARLRDRAVRACWSLAEVKERAGDAATAAEWGRRAVEIAPADDTQIMRLMQLLARAGDRSEALAAFEAYARRLHKELEVEPTEAAAALAEQIRRAQPGQPERVAAHVGSETTTVEAVEPGPKPPAPIPAAPTETQPAAPTTTARMPTPTPSEPVGARDEERGVGRDGVAPGLLLTGLAGGLVGIPVALLAVGLGHALRPGTVPAVERAVLLSAAGLLVAEAALLAVWVMGRHRARLASRPSGKLGAGLGFALGALVTLSLAYTQAPHAAPPPRAPPLGTPTVDTVKRKVAVTRFANLTGDPALDPIGRLAEGWVVRRLRSIPEAEVVAIASATAADTSLNAVTALAQRTGADLVLFGGYYREGGDVLLTASLVPPRGGRIPPEITRLAIGPVRTPRDRPVGGVDRLASMVAGAVADGCRFPGCLPGRRAPLYEARQLYEEAYQALDRGDREAARQKFGQASHLDSTFGSAYTHFAEWSSCAQKDSMGEIMEARRQDFGPVDLLYMRILRAFCRGDVEAIYRLRRQQLELAPENPGTRVGTAWAAYRSGRLREAEARYRAGARLGAHQEPLTVHNAGLTYVLHLEGKIAEELRVAAEARRRLPDDPQTPSLGLRGLAALGRTQELEARVEEARRGAPRLLSVAEMYYTAALELEWHGHAAAARQFALSALRELDRTSPAEHADARYVPMRMLMLLELGRWGEVRRLADAADLPDDVLMMVRGLASAGAGDVAGARAALTTLGRLPDSAFAGYNLDAQWVDVREYCQASVLAALGEKDDALRRLEEARARNALPRSAPYFTHADYFPLRGLWHDPRFERMFAARD